MKDSFKKVYSLLRTLLPLVGAFSFALILVKAGFPNSDTFFIIKTGEYIVENGIVPTINPFIIHEGFGIIVQQWLFDVMIYHIYNIGGNMGLFVYSAVVLLVAMVMMYKFFGFYSDNVKLKVLLLSLCTVIAGIFAVARPTSISFLMCLSVVMVMEVYRKTQRWPILLLLPVLSLATINFHASMWPILFVLMVPYIFPDKLPQVKTLGLWKGLGVFFHAWFRKWKWVLLAMLGMLLAGFVNPNGLRGMCYLLLSYGSATTANRIAELQAPKVNAYDGICVIVSTLLLFHYVVKFRGGMDFAKFYMAAGTTLLAATHGRNLWFLFFGTTPLFLSFFNAYHPKRKLKEYRSAVPYAVMVLCYVCIIVVLLYVPVGFGSLEVRDNHTAPVEAASYLDKWSEANQDEIVLFTEFNNGAFMEMNGHQVYIDARPELFQKKINGKEDIYNEYLTIVAGTADFPAFFEKYSFTHLIVSDGTMISGYLMADDSYQLVVDGNGYCLFERQTNAHVSE